MKRKQLTTTLMVLSLLALPAVSFASTYQYIDKGGQVQSVQANSSAEALTSAYNIGTHSGVILVTVEGIGGSYESPTVVYTNTGGSFYQFVDRNGNVQSISAPNSSTALATAPNIGLHSGVVIVTNSTTVN
ncbi:MAG: hypothetical protein WDZ64_00970 [Parcubacteria group bacterium]